MVVTDSQVFAKVAAETPREVPLTSFSMLFSRYKGDLAEQVRGTRAVAALEDGDRILIAEGCTFIGKKKKKKARGGGGDDVGTVKIPRWLRQHRP